MFNQVFMGIEIVYFWNYGD